MKIYSTSWEPFYSANLNLWKNIYEIENIVIGQIHHITGHPEMNIHCPQVNN